MHGARPHVLSRANVGGVRMCVYVCALCAAWCTLQPAVPQRLLLLLLLLHCRTRSQGDSGFVVIRDGKELIKSKPLQHYFDCPLQFGAFPEYVEATDTAEMADLYNIALRPYDIIVAGGGACGWVGGGGAGGLDHVSSTMNAAPVRCTCQDHLVKPQTRSLAPRTCPLHIDPNRPWVVRRGPCCSALPVPPPSPLYHLVPGLPACPPPPPPSPRL